MQKIIKQLPNFITALNLISGSTAVIFAIDGHLIWAGIFICMAAVFDFLDGVTARLMHAHTKTGEHLDSLSDLVSFGLAPGAILFTLLEFSLFQKNQPIYDITTGWMEWLILFSALLMPVMGAIRLARFNTGHSDNFFKGLPIPANGLFWASLGLMLELPRYHQVFEVVYSTRNLLLLGLFTSFLMVSNLPMFSLKFHSFKFKANWFRYLFLITTIILIAFFTVYGIVLSIFTYIFLNVVFYVSGIKY